MLEKNNKELFEDFEEEYEKIPEKDSEEEKKTRNEILLSNNLNFLNTELTVSSIVELFEDNNLKIPWYQRGFTWDNTKMIKFIESIFLDYPIPSIILNKRKEDFFVLDGLQRITTILNFWGFVKGLPSEKIDEKSNDIQKFVFKTEINQEWNKKNFKTLKEEFQKKFKRKRIPITIIESTKEKDSTIVLADIYERLNTGSAPLSPQNIRDAVFLGEFIKFLSYLNKKSNVFNILRGKKSKKSKEDSKSFAEDSKSFANEMILRILFQYYNFKEKKEKDLTVNNLNLFCEKLCNKYKNKNEKKEIEDLVMKIITFLKNQFEKNENIFRNLAFKEGNFIDSFSRVNKLYIEAFSVSYMLDETLILDKNKLKEFKKKYGPAKTGKTPEGEDWTTYTSQYEKMTNRIKNTLEYFSKKEK